MKPEIKVKLELWDNYQDFLSSRPWWFRWIARKKGWYKRLPFGAYSPITNTVYIFLTEIYTAVSGSIIRQGIPIHEEPSTFRLNFCIRFYEALIHELIHASGIETVQGSHQISHTKLKRLPIWLRALVEDYLMRSDTRKMKHSGGLKSIFDGKGLE